MLNTILVALDVSAETVQKHPLSDQVVRSLLELNLQPTMQVVFANVVPMQESSAEVSADRPPADVEPFPYAHIERQLQHYQAQLPCESAIEIVTGDPADEIIRLANIYKVDLILLGSRGLTGMQRILLGSVSSQIVADAPCSVWVVKPTV